MGYGAGELGSLGAAVDLVSKPPKPFPCLTKPPAWFLFVMPLSCAYSKDAAYLLSFISVLEINPSCFFLVIFGLKTYQEFPVNLLKERRTLVGSRGVC